MSYHSETTSVTLNLLKGCLYYTINPQKHKANCYFFELLPKSPNFNLTYAILLTKIIKMPVSETQQIQRYYDFYRDKEIAFTKETLHYLRIDPRQIFIKCGGGQWPCIINSTSFQFSKIIVGAGSGAFQLIKKQKDIPVSVRYCFVNTDNSPLSFFVNGRVSDIKPFNNSSDLVIITVSFSQQPPDDLILRLGQFIDTNENFIKRKEERIIINGEIVRKLGLEKEETIVTISDVPRRCVLRDLSFGGAKVMCMGIPKFLENKPAALKINFLEPPFSVNIPGVIRSAECLAGRKDIVTANIAFDETQVPMAYKVQINDFLVNNQKMLLELNRANTAQQQERQAAVEQGQPIPSTAAQPEQPKVNPALARTQMAQQTQPPKPQINPALARTQPAQQTQMPQPHVTI